MKTRPDGRARAFAILTIIAVVAIPATVAVASWGDLPHAPMDLRPDPPSADWSPMGEVDPAAPRPSRTARADERVGGRAVAGSPAARDRRGRSRSPAATPGGERPDRPKRATERGGGQAATADGTPVARGRRDRDRAPDAQSDRPRRRDRPADTGVNPRSEVIEASPQAEGSGESARDQSAPNV